MVRISLPSSPRHKKTRPAGGPVRAVSGRIIKKPCRRLDQVIPSRVARSSNPWPGDWKTSPPRSSNHSPARSVGECILLDGHLLEVNRQFAPGGRDDLRIDRAVDRVADEAHASVTEPHVAATGVSAVRERIRALDRQALPAADVGKRPDLVRQRPADSIQIA